MKIKKNIIEENTENKGFLNGIRIFMNQALMPIFLFDYNDNKGIDLNKINYSIQNNNDNIINENISNNIDLKIDDEDNLRNSESFDFDEESKELDIQSNINNDEEYKTIEKMIIGNLLGFLVVFGNNVKKRFFNFMQNFNIIMEYANEIENPLYCLSFGKIKKIIEYAKENKGKEIVINDKFYNLVVNDIKKIKKYESLEDIYKVKGRTFKLLTDLHIELLIQ